MEKNNLTEYIQILLNSTNWYIEQIDQKKYRKENINSFCISIIIQSWSALEAFINLICIIGNGADKLQPHEKAFLVEKELKLNDNGEFEANCAYPKTTKKILFILNKFSKSNHKAFKKSSLWSNIKSAEDIRNSLIHPKVNIKPQSYSNKSALFVYKTVKESIKYLNVKVLKIKYFSKIF